MRSTGSLSRVSRGSIPLAASITKLNRSHIVHGAKALILPCLARSERDEQESGRQGQTVEDAMSMVHLSVGGRKPASDRLLAEPDIIARMARATTPESTIPWEEYVADYARVRDVMGKVLPGFEGFNELIATPTGFRIPQPARERDFRTPTGRAVFSPAPLHDVRPPAEDMLVLQTMRAHDQWNTTVYTANDRYRGVKNLRELIFLHEEDMRERGIAAGYMPEMNVLIGPNDFSAQSDQPLMKSINIRVAPAAA